MIVLHIIYIITLKKLKKNIDVVRNDKIDGKTVLKKNMIRL